MRSGNSGVPTMLDGGIQPRRPDGTPLPVSRRSFHLVGDPEVTAAEEEAAVAELLVLAVEGRTGSAKFATPPPDFPKRVGEDLAMDGLPLPLSGPDD